VMATVMIFFTVSRKFSGVWFHSRCVLRSGVLEWWGAFLFVIVSMFNLVNLREKYSSVTTSCRAFLPKRIISIYSQFLVSNGKPKQRPTRKLG